MENNVNKNNLSFGLVTIIVLLAVLLAVSLTYIFLNTSKDKNQNNETSVDDTTVTEDDSLEEVKVKSSYYQKKYYEKDGEKWKIEPSEDGEEYYYISVNLPMIESNKPGAQKLNSKITEENNDLIDLSNNLTLKPMLSVYDYSYITKNEILFVTISNTKVIWLGSGTQFMGRTYAYDIKNDQELSFNEMLSILNIDSVKLKSDMKSEVLKVYADSTTIPFNQSLIENLDLYGIESITENKIKIYFEPEGPRNLYAKYYFYVEYSI